MKMFSKIREGWRTTPEYTTTICLARRLHGPRLLGQPEAREQPEHFSNTVNSEPSEEEQQARARKSGLTHESPLDK